MRGRSERSEQRPNRPDEPRRRIRREMTRMNDRRTDEPSEVIRLFPSCGSSRSLPSLVSQSSVILPSSFGDE